MSTPRTVVIGGGLAGLTAAYYLRKGGHAVTLLEASNRVGGRVATKRRDGYTLDLGATQISTGYAEYLKLCRELGLDAGIVPSSSAIGFIRKGRIHVIDGRRPLGMAFSPLLSVAGKFKALRTTLDYVRMRPPVNVLDVSAHAHLDTESAADYAQRRTGREVYDTLIDPLMRAYVMTRADRVSALEWYSTLGNIAGREMISINRGNDMLPRALAEGLDLRLATPAQALRRVHGGVEVDATQADGSALRLQAEHCVLATRLPEALAIDPTLQDVAGELNSKLHYNRGLVVQLGYPMRPRCPAIGLLLGAVEHPDIGLIWLEHNKNPDRVPKGHALYSVYFDEVTNDANFAASEAVLRRIASGYVEQLFPELSGRSILCEVTRWPMAIPNPAPGVYQAVQRFKAALDAADPVQLAGDYFTCVGQNSAIHYGRRAAEAVLAQPQRSVSAAA